MFDLLGQVVHRQEDLRKKIFEQAIIKHFGEFYTVSGQTRINTGSLNKPFELDISLINKIDDQICINVEI